MNVLCKRLIEVDLPIKRISAHARREKSIRHGHISTLHIWWARRPLAACRAVICASLWPDPADPNCPKAFREAALNQMTAFAKATQSNKELADICDADSWKRYKLLTDGKLIDLARPKDLNKLQQYLLDFIADFAAWESSTNRWFLDTARSLTQAAHEALGGEKGTRPLVVDPFAGGGAIPLEALRVGADAFASDLNPVAVLLNKAVLEYIPRYGQKLADEVRKWGQWINVQAEKELSEFYHKNTDGANPIAYLWARTIQCEGPSCGAEVPLITSLWLGKKKNNPWSLRITVKPRLKRIEVSTENLPPEGDGEGTVKRGSVVCPVCGYTTATARVRAQLKVREGGSSDARMLAVVETRPTERGRFYRSPSESDLKHAQRATATLEKMRSANPECVPDEPTPVGGGSGAGRAFSQRSYGMDTFGSLFTHRQLLTASTFCRLVRDVRNRLNGELERGLADATQLILAFAVDKLADYGSSLATWSSPASQETVRQTFSRQALSISWDFAEAYPFAESSGGWSHNLDYVIRAVEFLAALPSSGGTAERIDAASHTLPDDSALAVITDPPYYDAIPYADLSDFFLIWLKRSLAGNSAFSLPLLSPKDEECVVDETKGHDNEFFLRTMTAALSEARRYARHDAIGTVVFAHKSTLGWEAQLNALIDAGWVITGSWPIDTERQGRMRANSSAALASSVHLICRPREHADGTLRRRDVGDWRDVLAELPKRMREWMSRLAEEGVVGADAIFACLGPALEIFSRYSCVEKASGEQVLLKEYLTYVWGAVAQEALAQIFKDADATGFEEDARLTAMWLWTLNAGTAALDQMTEEADDAEAPEGDDEAKPSSNGKTSGYVLEFDAARKIAQGLGAHLEELGGVVEVKGDKARLLGVAERTRHLFGKDEADAPQQKRKKKEKQMRLFSLEEVEAEEGGWGDKSAPKLGDTTLDRVHQSMILFAASRGEALRRFLVEDGAGQDQRFWKLANALSALYPQGTDEKRWVDGVLARKKGLGL